MSNGDERKRDIEEYTRLIADTLNELWHWEKELKKYDKIGLKEYDDNYWELLRKKNEANTRLRLLRKTEYIYNRVHIIGAFD